MKTPAILTTHPPLHISKLDAARRQLETAIRLYFASADPVSIHTLTAAAHRILADLSKGRPGPVLGPDGAFIKKFAPEDQSKARLALSKAANFFKHADRDPDGVVELLPSQTEFLLMDACEAYEGLTGEQVPLLVVFRLWFFVEAGKALRLDPQQELQRTRTQRAFPHRQRARFLADALTFAASLESGGSA